MSRPSLPLKHANPYLVNALNSPVLPPVKYQILNCQGQDILVGRLKIETPTVGQPFFHIITPTLIYSRRQPSGHAFILRRFDTGAVSLTTMFRAAFPTASEAEEKAEVQWVKDTHDLSGNNGSSKDPHITRLAGVWVSPPVARELGTAYGLGALIAAVVDANPDPNGNYRRSGKVNGPPSNNQTAAAAPVSNPAKSLPTPSPSASGPNPPKRRKESSPVPRKEASPVPVVVHSPTKPPSTSPSKVPVPRRSTRTKSPAPRPAAMPSLTSVVTRTPKSVKPLSQRREEVVSPSKLDKVRVDEEDDSIEDGVAGSSLHHQDVQEQKELIEDLKARREAAKKSAEDKKKTRHSVEIQAEDRDEEMEDVGPAKKRAREEEGPLRFEFHEPQPESQERQIVTNRRVGRFHMEPRTKSFAWGVAAFAIGMGAVSMLPSFF